MESHHITQITSQGLFCMSRPGFLTAGNEEAVCLWYSQREVHFLTPCVSLFSQYTPQPNRNSSHVADLRNRKVLLHVVSGESGDEATRGCFDMFAREVVCRRKWLFLSLNPWRSTCRLLGLESRPRSAAAKQLCCTSRD